MIGPHALLDLGPPGVTIAAGALLGGALFFIAVAVAIVVFKLLKRSLKMAFRIVIVALILIVALIASAGIFIYSISGGYSPTRPERPVRQR